MLSLIAFLLLQQPPAAAPPAPPPPTPEFRSSDLPNLNIERKQAAAFRTDVIELPLEPKGQVGGRLEFKVRMKAGDAMVYGLIASGAVVSEFHGEAEVNRAVMFYREEKAMTTTHGQFVAPMDGIHGWYLANTTDQKVTVRIQLAGYYLRDPGLILINRP